MKTARNKGYRQWQQSGQSSNYVSPGYRQQGPYANCLFSISGMDTPKMVKVAIIKLFQNDLTCVQAVSKEVNFGRNGCWLVRKGILWPGFLSDVLFCYRVGLRVPRPFIPVKRIPDGVLKAGIRLQGGELEAFFTRLRQSGFLPALPKLKAATCPPELNWKTIRRDFQNF